MSETKDKDPGSIEVHHAPDTLAHPADIQPGKLKENIADYDAVFGKLSKDGPHYRSLGWMGTIALMLKTQIGLGILSLPSVFHVLGIVPGAILLCVVALLACWTSYMVGVFKLKHREVYGFDDAAGLMFGRVGREAYALIFWLYWVFNGGSGMLSLSIGLNAVSNHGACTAIFVVVAALVGFSFGSIRTLGKIQWIASVGLAAVLTAVFIVTIAVGVQNGPSSAPQGWTSDYKIVNKPSFAEGVSAVSTLIFACSATPGYFSIAAEMRDPRYFTRSVLISQAISTVVYLVVGLVVYYYCGSLVASPALGSAGPSIKRIAYGFAIPGLVASTTLSMHYVSKYAFVRLLRGSKHLTLNSFTHWATWLGCTFGCTMVAYVIASGIPIFSDLVSLIGALLGFLLAYQPAGCMWLYDNWSRSDRDWKWTSLVAWSVFLIVIGSFMTVAGTYGSVVSIVDALRDGAGTQPWTCADNST